ncbi:MAG TPA: signal peptidase I [Actinomycetota bacterium]|nr:signal peptidase I [Actinomycetota bacterium]
MDYRSWFVGYFVRASDARSTTDVEVKWSTHPAGDIRPDWNPDEVATTLCLLVQGRFKLHFAARAVTFRRPGDYAVWRPGIKHRWEAVEDSIVLTIRWPSVPS